MLKRCNNPANKSFADYGAMGIAVHPRWTRFEAFVADMGERPPGTTIDRIDNSRGYEPGNCRWATPAEQRRNTRHAWRCTIGDETMCAKDWAERYGVSRHTLCARLRRGLDVSHALAELTGQSIDDIRRGSRLSEELSQ